MDLTQSITGLEITAVFADLTIFHKIRYRPEGEVETFSGKVHKQEAGHPIEVRTEDAGSVLLRFSNGAVGAMWVTQMTAGRKNALRYEIAGSEGTLAWNGERPNEMWLGHRDEPNGLLVRDPGLVSDAAERYITYPGGHNEGYDDSFKQCFKAYYDYLAAGDHTAPRPFPTFMEGHKEIVLCEAILQSHRDKRWVDVADQSSLGARDP
jgi:predicted dehydrogenase